MRSPLRSAPLLLALALSLAAPVPSRAAAPKKRDLSGTWTFNEDLTAKLREEARRNRDEAGNGPGMGGMGRRRRAEGGAPEGGSPEGGGRREGGGAMEHGAAPAFQEALDELTITQTADTVTVATESGHRRVLPTDGRKVHDEGAPGGPAELSAEWSAAGSLVVEVKPQKGPKRTEVYAVSTDRQHLFLTIAGGGDHGMKIIRAYDAAPPAPSAPAAPPPAPPGGGAGR
jgi:hypothetical protein